MNKLILILVVILVGIVVLPTTLLLFAGMAPSIGAFLIDKTKEQLKGMTVGALNFSACFYYWLQLVFENHTLDMAWEILTPVSMSIMYAGAIVGYLVEWGVSLAVATIMVQKAKNKIRSIEKQKEQMIERWGVEVTGRYSLDEYGFQIKG